MQHGVQFEEFAGNDGCQERHAFLARKVADRSQVKTQRRALASELAECGGGAFHVDPVPYRKRYVRPRSSRAAGADPARG